jgi:branched-chain amino acid transport system ATP-binding protein
VILLDEPAAGVAPALRALMAEKIGELNRQGVSFVVIEHDMEFVMRLCDPVVALAEGRVIFRGPAAAARADAGLVAAYLGTPA